MYHTIEFVSDFTIDLDESGTQRVKQMQVRKGTQFQVWLAPYVVDCDQCPVEVADLYTSNGSVLRTVPFGFFSFVD
jgi:hypothetical protein